jgi:hypothetical protein
MFVGNIRITGAVSGDTKAFTTSIVADKRYTLVSDSQAALRGGFTAFEQGDSEEAEGQGKLNRRKPSKRRNPILL